jgi:dihydrodipicolinate synthase/N-acetylneuraminate lyase
MPSAKIDIKTDHGVVVPLVTPLTQELRLDEPALRRLIDHVISGGVKSIFVLGTTGEGPSVPRGMRARIVQVALEQANGRASIYAGTADTVQSEVIAAGVEYLRMGARAVVVQLPAYFVLSPTEQFAYFTTLVKAISGPILLYDMPAMVHMTIDLGVIEHLRAFHNVIGIKDSSGDRERLQALLDAYSGDPGFSVLVGTIDLSSFGMQNGADGFVPSTANLDPALCVRLYASSRTGDSRLMKTLQAELTVLTDTFRGERTIGQSIARLKRLMSQKGLCGPAVFPPLRVDE